MLALFTFISIAFIIVLFLKWRYTYWKRKQVPFLSPRMIFGNVQNPFTRNMSPAQEYQLFYNAIKSKGWKHAGVFSFTTPVYVPTDLDYIKNILAKDFQYFDERGRYYNEKDDPISAHLFNLGGSKWKELRRKFTPSFSSAKLKSMFENILKCGRSLENAAAEHCNDKKPVEVKLLADNFTADVIGLCVFGVRIHSLHNTGSEFLVHMAKFLKGTLKEAALMALTFSFPKLSKFLKVPRYDKEATGFFTSFIADLVHNRESKNIKQNDFLQTLVELKNGGGETNSITMEQLIAQAMIFLVAGYDSTASTVAHVLYELSVHMEMQEKLQAEIDDLMINSGGKLTYDNMGELQYMQKVINEALRKYPPLAILNRQSNSEYKIPDSDVVLDKGTPVIISLLGLHYDPEHFPNPEEFDPERFSTENIKDIKPYSYLPFGEGPKNCLGVRFGTLNVKVALCILLKNYTFTLNSKTQIPFKFEMGILNTVKGGIWLNIEKRL